MLNKKELEFAGGALWCRGGELSMRDVTLEMK